MAPIQHYNASKRLSTNSAGVSLRHSTAAAIKGRDKGQSSGLIREIGRHQHDIDRSLDDREGIASAHRDIAILAGGNAPRNGPGMTGDHIPATLVKRAWAVVAPVLTNSAVSPTAGLATPPRTT